MLKKIMMSVLFAFIFVAKVSAMVEVEHKKVDESERIANKKRLKLIKKCEAFIRWQEQRNSPLISQPTESAIKTAIVKSEKDEAQSEEFDELLKSRQEAVEKIEKKDSPVLFLCGKPVNVKEGYTPEMVKALYELEGMDLPVENRD